MSQNSLAKELLEHRDLLLSFILALTRDRDVAEEIFQETALAIIDESTQGTQVENFQAWAREVARRRILEYFRTRSRRLVVERTAGSMAEVVSQAFDEHAPAPEECRQRETALRDCLAKMKGRAREVVERHYRDRLGLAEIARELAWKADSVKVALSRARKSLAACVQARLRGMEAL